MIDTYGYYHFQNYPVPELEPLLALSSENAQEPRNTLFESVNGNEDEDNDAESRYNFGQTSVVSRKDTKPPKPLTDEQCLFAWPFVKAFAMLSKSWSKFPS